MNRILAVAAREWKGYFLSPTGYIIMAVWSLLTGVYFVAYAFDQGQPASLRVVFEAGFWLLLFVCPAISMRAISEERRLGTFELLMTSPISELGIVIGKFTAALLFLAVLLLPTSVLVIALEMHGQPDYGELACGASGLLLVGAAYLASGVLASSLTNSQVVAFLVTVFFWMGLGLGAAVLPAHLPSPWSGAAYAINPDPRSRDFAVGLVDTANLVYFVSITGFFLIAAACSLAMRRTG